MHPLVLSACCLFSGAAWLGLIQLVRRFPVDSFLITVVVVAILWFFFVTEAN
jgi:hypothetical protein